MFGIYPSTSKLFSKYSQMSCVCEGICKIVGTVSFFYCRIYHIVGIDMCIDI